VHGGRRTAVARADVVDADGRPIAVASGSAIAEGARPLGARL
jgi:acyl-coenzyme A thioesterase PaaI-like protein